MLRRLFHLALLSILSPIFPPTSQLLADEPSREKTIRIAAVVTEYRHNSHADVIVSRLLQTFTLDGKGKSPKLKLVSLYTDQTPQSDISRKFSKQYGFPIFDSVEGALTLGGNKLAVEGVLLIAEHGEYRKSSTGQTIYPKRRLFEKIAGVFEKNHRSVPVFCDKHLADNWKDAKWLYDTAKRLKAPLMAGSSLPMLWRYPPVDVRKNASLKEIVAVSYHTLDAYGFHAMEMVQTLAERRKGGETGIKSVQCLQNAAVWKAETEKIFDVKLLQQALARLKRPVTLEDVKKRVKNPILFIIDYKDGLRVNVFTLNHAVGEWAAAWRYAETGKTESTLFWTQEARPFMHFSFLVQGIDRMMHTGKATWPVERTLMTSGALDALLISKANHGKKLKTPYLEFSYKTEWNWKQPPPPPKGRPINGQ